jgi:hypothetical protein
MVGGCFLLAGCTSKPSNGDQPIVKDKTPQQALAPVDKNKEALVVQPAGAKPGAVNSMDATWNVSSVEFRGGEKTFSYGITDVQMAIKDGVGVWWENGRIQGTITVDLSQFETFEKGFYSTPFQLGYTKGPNKGQTWDGICSRCGAFAIVCFSLKDRPENYKGSEAQPVIVYSFEQQFE